MAQSQLHASGNHIYKATCSPGRQRCLAFVATQLAERLRAAPSHPCFSTGTTPSSFPVGVRAHAEKRLLLSESAADFLP